MWGKKEEESSTPESGSPQVQPDLPSVPAAAPSSAPGPMARERGRSVAQIGKSLKLKGEISGSEDLYIDGEVDGNVELQENSLTIGPNGKVHADVTARSITVHGRLKGNARASERVEIRKTGSLEGDLETARIVIEDGAVFRGSIDIIKAGEPRRDIPVVDKRPMQGTSVKQPHEVAARASAAGGNPKPSAGSNP